MIEDSLGLLGKTIAEKYLVEKVVGEGGFAVVYRAEHVLWKRPVALKVFKALADLNASVREELTQDFIREGALLAELSEKSTSICQARDVGVLETGTGVRVPYMVLEWLEGETLEDALRHELVAETPPRTLLETIRLLDPVAEALALAHARGIAHRDVKPANVFLLGGARDPRCPVKLLDFGIAKVVQDLQKAGGAFSQTGGTVRSFTPAYAAPEQFSRSYGATGPWTDVFSLALVAVELVTGRPPLDGESFVQLGFAAGDTAHRPTPRARGAATTDAVEAVFLRALAVERMERYASADAFWQDLHAAVGLTGPALTDSQLNYTRAPVSVPRHGVDVLSNTVAVPDVVAASATMPVGTPPPKTGPGIQLRWLGGAGVLGLGLLTFVALHRGDATTGIATAVVAAGSPGLPVAGSSFPSAPAAPAAPSTPGMPAVASSDGCPDGMVSIPGGPFFMGSDDGAPPERPAHKVLVGRYCMDVTEVTTAKYAECSDKGLCLRAAMTGVGDGLAAKDQAAYDQLCNARDREGHAEHPINCVTWENANVFCKQKGARLPTEAEWEFAARGSDGRKYPWGDEAPNETLLNACGTECTAWAQSAKIAAAKPMYDASDGWPGTAPVGTFPKGSSRFGVKDLAGNVWEWVGDWYAPYKRGDGLRAEESPAGPDKGTGKVIRGGAWNGSDPSWETPSYRYWKDPVERSPGVGFRCAADPK